MLDSTALRSGSEPCVWLSSTAEVDNVVSLLMSEPFSARSLKPASMPDQSEAIAR